MTVRGVVEKGNRRYCTHTGADAFSDTNFRLLYCSDCGKYLRYWIGDFSCGWIPANIFYRILFVWGRF
jgi:hypothetical protein